MGVSAPDRHTLKVQLTSPQPWTRATPDNAQRYQIYGQLQQILFGQNGAVPFSPIYWYTFPTLIKPSLKATYKINPLNSVDLTKVKPAA